MTRAQLPNRRQVDLLDFRFGDLLYTMGVGRFGDGRPAEVFVDCVRTVSGRSANTTDMAQICRDAAILISLALQHSVSADTMRAGISRLNRGEPATVIGHVLDSMCVGDLPPPKRYPPEVSAAGEYIGLSREVPV